MLRHLVIHEGIIVVPDDPARIGDLRDIASTVALVFASPMPDLIVEQAAFSIIPWLCMANRE
jgi:hypothetical protein